MEPDTPDTPETEEVEEVDEGDVVVNAEPATATGTGSEVGE